MRSLNVYYKDIIVGRINVLMVYGSLNIQKNG